LGEPIDNLALAFVAPLGADHDHIRHQDPFGSLIRRRGKPGRSVDNGCGPGWQAIGLAGFTIPTGADVSWPARPIGDELVAGPAHPPAELDLLRLAGRRLEAPCEHTAPVAYVALGRRRRNGEHLDLDIGDLTRRNLVLDHNLDRPV